MAKNNQNEEFSADLQIGPTDQGMVRLIILESGRELNLDFDPEEAMEIAEEIQAAAKIAASGRRSR